MNVVKRVLVVCGDTYLAKAIEGTLQPEGYELLISSSVDQAKELIKSVQPDLIIIDNVLQGGSGYELCSAVRSLPWGGATYIIVLGECEDDALVMTSFQHGADGFLPKPVRLVHLALRVKSALLRDQQHVLADMDATASLPDNLLLDIASKRLLKGGVVLELTLKEVELIMFLVRNHDITFTRQALLDHVWEYGFESNTRTVDAHVSSIRHKLADCQQFINCIKTVRKVGYRFERIKC